MVDKFSVGLFDACKWKETMLDHRRGLYTCHSSLRDNPSARPTKRRESTVKLAWLINRSVTLLFEFREPLPKDVW